MDGNKGPKQNVFNDLREAANTIKVTGKEERNGGGMRKSVKCKR